MGHRARRVRSSSLAEGAAAARDRRQRCAARRRGATKRDQDPCTGPRAAGTARPPSTGSTLGAGAQPRPVCAPIAAPTHPEHRSAMGVDHLDGPRALRFRIVGAGTAGPTAATIGCVRCGGSWGNGCKAGDGDPDPGRGVAGPRPRSRLPEKSSGSCPTDSRPQRTCAKSCLYAAEPGTTQVSAVPRLSCTGGQRAFLRT